MYPKRASSTGRNRLNPNKLKDFTLFCASYCLIAYYLQGNPAMLLLLLAYRSDVALVCSAHGRAQRDRSLASA